ncbi:hypothetical protein OH77DRAFT_17480 [Trametes cingulata]|nr:hypothetical protein OH77DRAFT_17480 [Trametes cingulata]
MDPLHCCVLSGQFDRVQQELTARKAHSGKAVRRHNGRTPTPPLPSLFTLPLRPPARSRYRHRALLRSPRWDRAPFSTPDANTVQRVSTSADGTVSGSRSAELGEGRRICQCQCGHPNPSAGRQNVRTSDRGRARARASAVPSSAENCQVRVLVPQSDAVLLRGCFCACCSSCQRLRILLRRVRVRVRIRESEPENLGRPAPRPDCAALFARRFSEHILMSPANVDASWCVQASSDRFGGGRAVGGCFEVRSADSVVLRAKGMWSAYRSEESKVGSFPNLQDVLTCSISLRTPAVDLSHT